MAAYSNDQTGPSLGNKCSTEAKSLLIPKEMHYLEGKFTENCPTIFVENKEGSLYCYHRFCSILG